MPHPLAPPLSRLARWTRVTAIGATLLMVLPVVVHGWGVATSPAQRDLLTTMGSVEVDGDYVAWMGAGHWRSHVSVRYLANGSVDEVVVIRRAELGALLAGEAYEAVHRLPRPGMTSEPVMSFGTVGFQPPEMFCEAAMGGCDEATTPLLVWVKGDAWRGATPEDASHYSLTGPGWTGPPPPDARDGPVRPEVARTDATVLRGAPIVLGLALFGGIVGAVALAAHAYAAWRSLVPRRAPMSLGASGTTEERLLLVRLASLYVDGIRRSYRTSLATIVAITAAVLFFALPPMLDAVVRQFPMMSGMQEAHVALYVLVPLDVMLVAIGLWTVSYMGVRRELAGWAGMTREVEAEAARILGA